MEKETIRKELDKLNDPEANEQLRKLSPYDMMKLARIMTKLYNSVCPKCRRLLLNKTLKRYGDLCDTCKKNYFVVDCFSDMQELYKTKVKQ
jgi:hypothetical protein